VDISGPRPLGYTFGACRCHRRIVDASPRQGVLLPDTQGAGVTGKHATTTWVQGDRPFRVRPSHYLLLGQTGG